MAVHYTEGPQSFEPGEVFMYEVTVLIDFMLLGNKTSLGLKCDLLNQIFVIALGSLNPCLLVDWRLLYSLELRWHYLFLWIGLQLIPHFRPGIPRRNWKLDRPFMHR